MSGESDAPLRWPGKPALVAALVVAVLWSAALLTPHLGRALGLGSTGPFLDLHGMLAANEAAGLGLDPYVSNPLDPHQRPFLYSTWWLWPGHPGLTRADTGWLGGVVVAATLAAAGLMWRVRTWREALISGLVLLSPAWLLAVYRANNDLVIFVLLAVAVWALQGSRAVGRATGAILVGAMAILKYYPVAAVVGVLGAARRREMLVLFALVAAVVALGWPSLVPAVAAISRYGFVVTASVGLQAFGVKVLGEALAPHAPAVVAWLAGLAAGAAGFRLARQTGAPGRGGPERRWMAAALFGAVLVGAFVIGTSYSYKLVFLWGLLPWLVRDAPKALGRSRALGLLVLVLAAGWADGLMATVANTLGPDLSLSGRASVLAFAHGFAVVSQLVYWVLMGACLRLSLDWSRRQVSRLATVP
jgi:hypothetical protein